jgi:hypothetical protein
MPIAMPMPIPMPEPPPLVIMLPMAFLTPLFPSAPMAADPMEDMALGFDSAPMAADPIIDVAPLFPRAPMAADPIMEVVPLFAMAPIAMLPKLDEAALLTVAIAAPGGGARLNADAAAALSAGGGGSEKDEAALPNWPMVDPSDMLWNDDVGGDCIDDMDDMEDMGFWEVKLGVELVDGDAQGFAMVAAPQLSDVDVDVDVDVAGFSIEAAGIELIVLLEDGWSGWEYCVADGVRDWILARSGVTDRKPPCWAFTPRWLGAAPVGLGVDQEKAGVDEDFGAGI